MPAIRPGYRLRRSRQGVRAFAPRRDAPTTASPTCRRSATIRAISRPLLRARGLEGPAPLVVVLHGCTQDAAVYDHGSGWSRAGRQARLHPALPRAAAGQQSRALLQLVLGQRQPARHGRGGVDREHDRGDEAGARRRSRSGSSSPAFPRAERWPRSCSPPIPSSSRAARSSPASLMAAPRASPRRSTAWAAARAATPRSSAAKVRRASPHKGPWPRVQVWQGSADTIVVAEQRRRDRAAMGASARPRAQAGPEDKVGGYPRRTWLGRRRRAADRAIYDHRHGPRHPARSRHRRRRIGRGGRAYARRRPELHRPDRGLLRNRPRGGGEGARPRPRDRAPANGAHRGPAGRPARACRR